MSKQEERRPSIRFKGYTEPWEQRKLGEVLSERNIQELPTEQIPLVSFTVEQGVTPKTERYNREFLVREETKKYKYTKYNDIVYNPANLKFGAIARNKYGEAFFSPIYVTFEANYSNVLPEFIEKILTSNDFIQKALKFQEGTVYERMAVKADDFLKLVIKLPTVPEQVAIGSFFQELDQLITLQQRELDLIKEGKKTLLSKMFPKDGENFPEIRFPGFTDAWEQRKLGEVAEFTKGRGYSKGDIESSGVPIILYGRLYTDYQTIIGDVDTYVTMKNHSVLSEGNEIIVPSSGESSEEISRASVVAKKGVILGGDLNIIRLTEKFSSVFVAITLSNGSQQKELSKRAQGKSVVHLHNSDLKEVNLFFPTLPEQAAIGSFFQELDQLITLQQRELEILKTMKSALLKAMFA